MSSKSAAQIIAEKSAKDFPGFCKRFLYIKTKAGPVEPFVLNKPQMVIWLKLKELMDAGVPIRLVVLKARQYGISTFVQAFLLWLTVIKQGQNSLIIGQNLDMSGSMFGKIELMWELMPEWYKPKRDSKTRGKRLAFAAPNHGLLYVDTAENRDAGRSGTFQHVHCTEIPFWPDAKRTMDGLLQSVPMDPGTTVIIESTAHGVGDYFHTLWKQAEEGDSSFTPLFIPWFIHDEYEREPFKNEKLPDWILELGKKHGLSKAKMCFYHDKYQDFNCDLHTLQQEYPSSADEAFRSSGLQFFNQKSIDVCREKHVAEPIRKGMYGRRNDRPVWLDDERGKLWVWEEPQKGKFYTVGIDIASGRAGDYSAIQVLQSMRQVASYRGKLAPDELADVASWIGKVYNNALLIPERNGIGLATVLKLINDLHYSNVYTYQRLDTTTGSVSNDYGFTTTGKSRAAILEEVSARIRRGELEVKDERTLSEMESFVFADESGKKAEAASGANDDMVMALALAVHGSGYFFGGPVEAEYDPQKF
jgi:hypothetical protein